MINTILLIGLDEPEQTLIINILQDLGISIIVAHKWEEALSLLQNHFPVITIYNTRSRSDLFSNLFLFKNEPRTQKMMLVILYPSEISWYEIEPSCFSKYQADAYIQKPLRREELIGTIKQLLRS